MTRIRDIRKDKDESPVLRRAHRLADLPVESIKSVMLSYNSRDDLRVLGAGEAICRSRRDSQKVQIMRRKIERLRKALTHEHQR